MCDQKKQILTEKRCKLKSDKNLISNVKDQICKVMIPQLSPSKSLNKTKSSKDQSKSKEFKSNKRDHKKEAKSVCSKKNLSFKDLNNHFNNNQFGHNYKLVNDLEDEKISNDFIGVEMDRKTQNYQPDDR